MRQNLTSCQSSAELVMDVTAEFLAQGTAFAILESFSGWDLESAAFH